MFPPQYFPVYNGLNFPQAWITIMFFQLISLALVPLVALASPAPSTHNLYCFSKSQTPFDFRIDDSVTKEVCKTLSSGKYHPDSSRKDCAIADYDVKWFKERCESHKNATTTWKAGTQLRTIVDLKEPYDLYCFDQYVTFGNSPDASALTLDEKATKKVCSLSRGNLHDVSGVKACRVPGEKIDRFMGACHDYLPDDAPDYGSWAAGTTMHPVIDLTENA